MAVEGSRAASSLTHFGRTPLRVYWQHQDCKRFTIIGADFGLDVLLHAEPETPEDVIAYVRDAAH